MCAMNFTLCSTTETSPFHEASNPSPSVLRPGARMELFHVPDWFGYRFYNWAMNKSFEHDVDSRLWKPVPVPERKMARYRTAPFGKKRKSKRRRRS